jgi:hypothetical protein
LWSPSSGPEWRCSAKEKEFGNLTIISEGKG